MNAFFTRECALILWRGHLLSRHPARDIRSESCAPTASAGSRASSLGVRGDARAGAAPFWFEHPGHIGLGDYLGGVSDDIWAALADKFADDAYASVKGHVREGPA